MSPPLYIIPTIDVEGVHGIDPFNQYILGNVGGRESWGVYRLAEIFNRYGVSATFFVDCYEYTFWGEDRMEQVCTRLLELGQDVQLHTHPGWRDDWRDTPELRRLKSKKSYLPQHLDFMAKLSYEQQVAVLEAGLDLLIRWTGHRPVAHRSGGYSINEDTVRALRHTGIPIDSSMNIAHRNSTITWSTNRVTEREGLLELPVTVIRLIAAIGRHPIASKILKTSIDALTAPDLKSYCVQARRMNVRFLNLFMHSYSLLRYDRRLRNPKPDVDIANRLNAFLAWARSQSGISFVSCAALWKNIDTINTLKAGSDRIPERQAIMKLSSLGARKFGNALLKGVSNL